MENFDLKKYLAEGKLLKEEIDINKISKLGDYNETEDSYKYKDHLVQKYIDGGKTIYAVFKDRGEKTDSYGSPDFESSDLKKVEDFLTENKLFEEEEKLQMTYKGDPVHFQISKFGGTSEEPNETVLFISVGGKGKRGSKGSKNTLERRLKLLDQKVDKILFTDNDNMTKEIKSFSKSDFKIK